MRLVSISLILKFERAPNALLEFLVNLDRWMEELTKDSCLKDYRMIIEDTNPVIVDWAEVPDDG